MFNDWGIEKLGSAEYKESIRQMKHADKVIERILFLEGPPNLQHLGKLYIGQHTIEVLNCDIRKSKKKTLKRLNKLLNLLKHNKTTLHVI